MKYFIVSDVHGFYKELKVSLKNAGYDPNNSEHYFVSCGDLFDRGPDAKKCLDFVMSLPKGRRAFVKGNHEECLERILREKHFYLHDIHNRTTETICQLAGVEPKQCVPKGVEICNRKRKLKAYLNECKDYFEIKDYIFCHGFIPLAYHDYEGDKSLYYQNATKQEWYDARWENGFLQWHNEHKFEPEMLPKKTIVIGHWHTSFAHAVLHKYKKEWPDDDKNFNTECCFEPFYDDGIIGIDACTAYTHKVNCITIEEN